MNIEREDENKSQTKQAAVAAPSGNPRLAMSILAMVLLLTCIICSCGGWFYSSPAATPVLSQVITQTQIITVTLAAPPAEPTETPYPTLSAAEIQATATVDTIMRRQASDVTNEIPSRIGFITYDFAISTTERCDATNIILNSSGEETYLYIPPSFSFAGKGDPSGRLAEFKVRSTDYQCPKAVLLLVDFLPFDQNLPSNPMVRVASPYGAAYGTPQGFISQAVGGNPYVTHPDVQMTVERATMTATPHISPTATQYLPPPQTAIFTPIPAPTETPKPTKTPTPTATPIKLTVSGIFRDDLSECNWAQFSISSNGRFYLLSINTVDFSVMNGDMAKVSGELRLADYSKDDYCAQNDVIVVSRIAAVPVTPTETATETASPTGTVTATGTAIPTGTAILPTVTPVATVREPIEE